MEEYGPQFGSRAAWVIFCLLGVVASLMEKDSICFIFLGGGVHICLGIIKELSPSLCPIDN